MLRFTLLDVDPVAGFDAAAGYLPSLPSSRHHRGMVDCMIASVALRHRATLLAADIGLSRVATVVGIGLDDASIRD